MKISLVITTINKFNKNLRNYSNNCNKNKWQFILIGDKKTPYIQMPFGEYFNLKKQKKLNLHFAKICPENNYARKNVGYLIAMRNNDVIIETDDDNYPKSNFFKKPNLIYKTNEIKNNDWVNIYTLFTNKNVWPRGLPLDKIFENKIKLKKKIKNKFYLQQGVCEQNPDVDAIYRLMKKKINIKFKNNYQVSLGKALSPFNSQNTIWFRKLFPLMYLPVTCTMRCTDIFRSLICLRILQNLNIKILFFGTNVYQKRNLHDIYSDFELEIPMYKNTKKIIDILFSIKLEKGKNNMINNLVVCYKELIKNNILNKKEIIYLKHWIKDIKQLNL